MGIRVDKRIRAVLVFVGAASAAAPAEANAPFTPPLAMAVLTAFPLLILAFTALGGAGVVMKAKGHRRWKVWEIVLGMILLIIFSPLASPFLMLLLAIMALARSIQMLAWGIMARNPAEERKPYLAEARPGPLMAAGAGLLAVTVLSCGLFAVEYRRMLRVLMEPGTRGNLGAIRSALSIYYDDAGKAYPSTLEPLTLAGKYLPRIPKTVSLQRHADSNAVHLGRISDDAGGWLYNNDPKDESFGSILVNCTHTDSRGTRWTDY